MPRPRWILVVCAACTWLAPAYHPPNLDSAHAAPDFPTLAADGTTDDAPVLQAMIDAACARGGGRIDLPVGVLALRAPIRIAADVPIQLVGQGAQIGDNAAGKGGTELRYIRRDGSDALTLRNAAWTADQSRPVCAVVCRDFALTGGSPAEVASGPLGGRKPLGNGNGLNAVAAHHLKLERLSAAGFDRAGFVIDNCYYGSVRDCYACFNGTGFRFLSPNACALAGVVSRMNAVGIAGAFHRLGNSCVEGNAIGILFDQPQAGQVCTLDDVYFEANGAGDAAPAADLRGAGGAVNLELRDCQFYGERSLKRATTHPAAAARANAYRILDGTFWTVHVTGVNVFIFSPDEAPFRLAGPGDRPCMVMWADAQNPPTAFPFAAGSRFAAYVNGQPVPAADFKTGE